MNVRITPRPLTGCVRAIASKSDAHRALICAAIARHCSTAGENETGAFAALCAAGAVCMQILIRRGVRIGAHVAAVAGVADTPFDPVHLTDEQLFLAASRAFPVLDEAAGEKMQEEIAAAAAEKDSVGGIVECGVTGLPAGLGEPLFEGIENRISAAIFGIGAVRGIEFGAGFAAAAMRGGPP